jgi:hypothetical protein
MLVTKDNNSSAQLIPLTTSFAMFGTSKGFDGKATMSLQPLASTEKIFFPGCDALAVCQHQTYNTETHDFSGINQAITSRAGGFGGGDGWGRDVDLTARLTDAYWYKNFNRVSNWCDFSTYSTNESANYYSGATTNTVSLNIPNIYTKYDAAIRYVSLNITGNTPNDIVSVWNNSNDITIDINPLETYQANNTFYVNCSAYNNERSQETTASQYYMLPAMIIFPISSNTALYDFIDKSHAITSLNYNNIHIFKDTTTLGSYEYVCSVNEQLYFSAFTASIENCRLDNPPMTLTGDDLFFNFDNTGTNVTGTVTKLYDSSVTTNVTANVNYLKIINSVSSTDVSNYKWSNTTGTTGTIGGGGGYSFVAAVYPPYSNKNIVNPTDMCKVTTHDDYKIFTLSSKNNIPDTYGGAILFSGNNLNSHFNQNDKFYCIGIKGVSYYYDNTASETELSNNFEGKLYKFNDEHFKKINDDTFVFFDDAISKIYTCTENSYTAGANIRKFAPIGPFFCEYTGDTRVYDDAGIAHYTFRITSGDLYSIPTVLHTMSYIHSFDPVKNTNQKYIIAKPAGAIQYSSDGFDKNHGNTDTYSYLALNLPTYVTTSTPLIFNSNITEITQLGDSVRAFTAMYSNNNRLTELTAIKSNFYNCMNIENAANLFSGASALVEVPSDFNNFNKLYYAPSMFSDCVSLTALPDFYGLHSLQFCPQMFSNCNKVTNMPLGTLTALTAAQAMFANCSSMSGNIYDKMIPPTNWESFAPNLELADNMFANCVKITDIQTDLSATHIRIMKDMFKNCSAITSDIGPILDFVRTRFYPDQVTAFSGAFMGCTAVHSGISSYNDIINDTTPAYEGGPTRADAWWKPLFGITT